MSLRMRAVKDWRKGHNRLIGNRARLDFAAALTRRPERVHARVRASPVPHSRKSYPAFEAAAAPATMIGKNAWKSGEAGLSWVATQLRRAGVARLIYRENEGVKWTDA